MERENARMSAPPPREWGAEIDLWVDEGLFTDVGRRSERPVIADADESSANVEKSHEDPHERMAPSLNETVG